MKETGVLYVVATPIGNLEDISLRAIATLKSVTKIAAEDTRHSRKLMQAIAVDTPLFSYHDFSQESAALKIIGQLKAGESIALISDAGTPLISDPGYKLVSMARQEGIEVLPIPGASALTAALSVAGLATDKFVFEGFLPSKSGARTSRLEALADEPRTMVFYESPHRILAAATDMQSVFADNRSFFLAREITKKFETHFLGTVGSAPGWLADDANQQKGEFVLILAGCDELELEARRLVRALKLVSLLEADVSKKKAVQIASQITGARKNQVYEAALKL